MRVIAGRLGGRVFDAPTGHKTKPMGDRVRGGLFNTLGDVEGLSVLDPFGGSGALSIEALSRGAARAVILESDRQAHAVIASNLRMLGLQESSKAINVAAGTWSAAHPHDAFDLVLADPPYDNIRLSLLQGLTGHLTETGLFVLSWPGKTALPELMGVHLVKSHSYGDAQLGFYKGSSRAE